MYHSVKIGDKDLYEDFYLVPEGQVSIAPPGVKTNTIEVPGASGLLDLSETLTGYPTYQNRSGEIKFHVLNDKPMSWQELYSDLLGYLHGQRMKMVLEDDPDYYYEGRFSVSAPTHNSDGTWTDIGIAYDVDPYKYYKNETSRTIVVNTTTSSQYLDFQDNTIGRMPIVPKMVVTSVPGNGLTITADNVELGISSLSKHITHTGTYKFYDIILSKINPSNLCTLNISGNGRVIISYRKGEL